MSRCQKEPNMYTSKHPYRRRKSLARSMSFRVRAAVIPEAKRESNLWVGRHRNDIRPAGFYWKGERKGRILWFFQIQIKRFFSILSKISYRIAFRLAPGQLNTFCPVAVIFFIDAKMVDHTFTPRFPTCLLKPKRFSSGKGGQETSF